MAFGAASKIFSSWMHDAVQHTGDADVDSATVKAALFNDTITGATPPTDTSAHNAYGGAGGQWAANNVTDTGTGAPAGWPTVGRPLAWGSATKISTYTTATLKYDSDDTVSASATTTLTNAFGCLIYDDAATTPTDQGFCMLSFGGSAQGVTLGTFTIVYHANGIMSIAM
jgi:hypothetical protein